MCGKNLTLFLTENSEGQAGGIMATGKNRVKSKTENKKNQPWLFMYAQ